jgi:hypothetical protein
MFIDDDTDPAELTNINVLSRAVAVILNCTFDIVVETEPEVAVPLNDNVTDLLTVTICLPL